MSEGADVRKTQDILRRIHQIPTQFFTHPPEVMSENCYRNDSCKLAKNTHAEGEWMCFCVQAQVLKDLQTHHYTRALSFPKLSSRLNVDPLKAQVVFRVETFWTCGYMSLCRVALPHANLCLTASFHSALYAAEPPLNSCCILSEQTGSLVQITFQIFSCFVLRISAFHFCQMVWNLSCSCFVSVSMTKGELVCCSTIHRGWFLTCAEVQTFSGNFRFSVLFLEAPEQNVYKISKRARCQWCCAVKNKTKQKTVHFTAESIRYVPIYIFLLLWTCWLETY